MRIFQIQSGAVVESQALASIAAVMTTDRGFVWIACDRTDFETHLKLIQETLQDQCGGPLVDFHVSDLLNQQLPSHYDFTSLYDILIFRRLTAGTGESTLNNGAPYAKLRPSGGPPILRRIDTSPVGFAIFERVLLTVHPADCAVRDAYATKLLQSASRESRAAGARLPCSPADLMLRIVNQMVDGYLDLRRELTRQLDHWQAELLDPKTRFNNWKAMLDARLSLHQLDEVCEGQRSAVQDWIEAVKTWPDPADTAEVRDRELLQIRSRDVLEHIERVVHHVRRLEQSTETAVQMHFNAQSQRANEIMRTLTVLTAIFLPLNLIAGIFGMNFEFIPLLHLHYGFWWAVGSMSVVALAMVLYFWRKRYLARTER